ncbi:MAG: L-threonylcarbamoyladenylate synthase [Bacteroidetes bacterium]|nr:L-threonylcarbamoyladenylate synthase [Bacteroidota bacterium]
MSIKTKILSVNEQFEEALHDALVILRGGGIIAFPTETVYGLGADALNTSAVKRVYEVKGRPSNNPLIVHIASISDGVIFSKNLPPVAYKLAEYFWPGPLTLIVEANDKVPRVVTGGLDTVALRVPKQEFTLTVLREFGSGIVGPSANISGRPSPTLAAHVLQDFDGKIDLILDAGPTHVGVESTVLDITQKPPVILRLGGLARSELESVVGPVRIAQKGEHTQRRSPGTQYRHYAPRAAVYLVDEGNVEELEYCFHEQQRRGKKLTIITHSDVFEGKRYCSMHYHLSNDLRMYARNLFSILRSADNEGCDVVLVESVRSEEGIGAAIMDRLRRAAGNE